MRRTMLSGTAAIALAAAISLAPGLAGADTATTTDTNAQTQSDVNAQSTDTQATDTQATDTQATDTQATDTEATTDAEATTEAEADAQNAIDAAELMGDSVENSAGDVLGDIETLVVADDGTIEHVVLGVGGFLGIGEKEVAVPWDRFTVVPAENRIVADVSREELESMPEFDWPENYQTGTLLSPLPATSATDQVADTVDPAASTTEESSATGEQTVDQAVDDADDAATGNAAMEAELQPLDAMLAGNVIGAEIIAANGEEIGEVDDVVLSADGTVQGVITEVGGFLGIDEKQVLIAWSDLDPRQDADGDLVLQVELDAAALEAMPTYDAQASN